MDVSQKILNIKVYFCQVHWIPCCFLHQGCSLAL